MLLHADVVKLRTLS